MWIEDLHSITFEFTGDLSVRAVLKTLLRRNVNQEPFVLKYSEFVLKHRNDFDKLFAFNSKFLIHGDVFNDDISEVISPCIQFMITAENSFLRQLMDCNISWVGRHCDLLRFRSKLRTPGPVFKCRNVSQVPQISRIERHFFISTCHYKIFSWVMIVDWNRIACDVSFTELFFLLSIAIEIVKCLVPTSY